MNTTEEWRVSPSLPEYEVSSWGRVRKIPYQAPMPHGGFRTYGGKAHYGQDSGEGRMVFVYKSKTYKVHQLVCEAFNGPRPEGTVCMHIDEDYTNNTPINLKWATQKENLNCEGFLAYCRSRTGENNPYVKGRQ
jgi:hypothetical protein